MDLALDDFADSSALPTSWTDTYLSICIAPVLRSISIATRSMTKPNVAADATSSSVVERAEHRRRDDGGLDYAGRHVGRQMPLGSQCACDGRLAERQALVGAAAHARIAFAQLDFVGRRLERGGRQQL